MLVLLQGASAERGDQDFRTLQGDAESTLHATGDAPAFKVEASGASVRA